MPNDARSDDAEMEFFAERMGEGGVGSTLFGNIFGYAIPWTPGLALWGYALGYSFWTSALLGLAIAIAGSAWIVFTAPSRWERIKRTGARTTRFGRLGTMVLFTGLPAAIVGYVLRAVI